MNFKRGFAATMICLFVLAKPNAGLSDDMINSKTATAELERLILALAPDFFLFLKEKPRETPENPTPYQVFIVDPVTLIVAGVFVTEFDLGTEEAKIPKSAPFDTFQALSMGLGALNEARTGGTIDTEKLQVLTQSSSVGQEVHSGASYRLGGSRPEMELIGPGSAVRREALQSRLNDASRRCREALRRVSEAKSVLQRHERSLEDDLQRKAEIEEELRRLD